MIEEIKNTLLANGNHADADYMFDYMRGKFAFLGIKTPTRRELTKDFIKDVSKLDIDEIVVQIDKLWNLEEREFQMLGLDIIMRSKNKFQTRHIGNFESWIINKSWWDTIDMIASHNIGNLFARESELRDKTIAKWLVNENIWLNRTCLLYQLKYKEATNLELLFYYIDELKDIEEFFIQKAIGWALRQASKFYPQEVKAYMVSHDLSPLAQKGRE